MTDSLPDRLYSVLNINFTRLKLDAENTSITGAKRIKEFMR